MNQDELFMQKALEQAKLAWQLNNEVPIGAVVVQDNRIIAVGSNLSITNLDPTAHAEIIAIRRAAQMLAYMLQLSLVLCVLEPSCRLE